MNIHDLRTPALLVERSRLEANIREMQQVCNRAGVRLIPHIKTHKMLPIARMQLSAGAAGFTCAKLSEAEVMLASEVRRLSSPIRSSMCGWHRGSRGWPGNWMNCAWR